MMRVVPFCLAWILSAAEKDTGSVSSRTLPPDDVPTVTINLDLPPRERWVEVAKANPHAVEAQTGICPLLRAELGSDADDWVKYHNFPAEYVEELQGIVDTLPDIENLSLDCLILLNHIYDLQEPLPDRMFCSGVLVALADGTVVHGRNSDFANPYNMFFQGLYKATFVREGKPLFVSAHTFPVIGVHSGMRFDGWTVEQNTRQVGINEAIDLAGAKRGGMGAFIGARWILEHVPDYSTAVSTFATENWMSPQYWILAGKGPYEGAVVTVDRMPEDGRKPMGNVETLNPYTRWFLVQTNIDRWKETNPEGTAALFLGKTGVASDDRFDQALAALSDMKQSEASEEWVNNLMLSPPLYNPTNIYYFDAVPAKNQFRLTVPARFRDVTTHKSLKVTNRTSLNLLQRRLSRKV